MGRYLKHPNPREIENVILLRRQLLLLATGAGATLMVPSTARTQGYPARSVRLVVGTPPGTSPDTIARLFGQWLSEQLGQPFVIENRPGAGMNVATDTVVRAPADGYTLLLSSLSNAVNATLYPKLNFNFLHDIEPVAFVGDNAFLMAVTPSLPVKTIGEFIAYAKAHPGKINMASGGNGSAPHMFGELFKLMAGVNLVHVPYRSSFYPDLFAGRVQVAFVAVAGSAALMKAGKIRALAVTTAMRSDVLPDLPAMREVVPGYQASAWLGVGAPKGTPAAAVATLNKGISAIVSKPDVKSRLAALGIKPRPMTPAEFGKFCAGETDKWAEVVRNAGIKAD
jgi:tripartite-type tricarboxylate transporter receptor subunit TctC